MKHLKPMSSEGNSATSTGPVTAFAPPPDCKAPLYNLGVHILICLGIPVPMK